MWPLGSILKIHFYNFYFICLCLSVNICCIHVCAVACGNQERALGSFGAGVKDSDLPNVERYWELNLGP